MVAKTWLALAGVVAGVVTCGATEASAQVLGTFRWQLAPFCNVVTLRVEQQGALYRLSGTDDRCGDPLAAAANGSAHVNPNGTATIALTVIRPDGIPVASSASISLVTLSGTWSDEHGNGGTFNFDPPGVGGSPRQVTLRGTYGAVIRATASNQNGSSSFSFGRNLPAAPLAPPANIILFGSPPTLDCPGSFDNPQAAPGHLCIYERLRSNVSTVVVLDSLGASNRADRTGATMFIASAAVGQAYSLGKWAVTIP